jgi:hypothetical protein
LACSWSSPMWLLVVVSGVAGATAPPIGALSSARWRNLLGLSERLPTAMSLEGALNDLTFLVGPVLVSALSATVASWLGLALAVSLVAVGVIGMLTAVDTEPAAGRSSSGLLIDHRLLDRRFIALFAANTAMGFFFGGVGVVITAFALAHHAGAFAGLITAVSGMISLTAGLVYGAVTKGRPLPVMITASVLITLGTCLLALVPNLPIMFVGYGLVGGCVALILIPGSILLQKVTVSEVYTQAMTWINSASAIGIATSAPVVGQLIQLHGWPAGFITLAALTAFLPITLIVALPILNQVQDTPVTQGA